MIAIANYWDMMLTTTAIMIMLTIILISVTTIYNYDSRFTSIMIAITVILITIAGTARAVVAIMIMLIGIMIRSPTSMIMLTRTMMAVTAIMSIITGTEDSAHRNDDHDIMIEVAANIVRLIMFVKAVAAIMIMMTKT
jgi:hypothetical protein